MTWAKFDDRYDDTRKIKRAWARHCGAVGLHVMAATYCSRHETDGFIEAEWIDEKVAALSPRFRRDLLKTMLDLKLLVAANGGYKVNDFLDYNPSRADLEKRRKRDAKRKRGLSKIRAESERNPNGIQAESKRNPKASRGGSRDGTGRDGTGRELVVASELQQRLETAATSNPKLRLDLEAVERALGDFADLPDLERHAIDCAEWLGGLREKRVAASTLRTWLRRVRDEAKPQGRQSGSLACVNCGDEFDPKRRRKVYTGARCDKCLPDDIPLREGVAA